MPLLQTFRNLSSKARIGVGVGLLAWGAIGLRVSDRAEEQYFKPSEEDRSALRELAPRITVVDRDARYEVPSSPPPPPPPNPNNGNK
ncbi:hypothetical protein GGR50DRAFT_646656 [Xylaria sp. CBS 124048]|nr:hypothetical protein GGR50DRAFT_646656 [Xylaria sp. CBS 124048]